MEPLRMSFIDFDGVAGRVMTPFLEPLSCSRCVRPASVVINGKLFCGECFLTLLQRRQRNESK